MKRFIPEAKGALITIIMLIFIVCGFYTYQYFRLQKQVITINRNIAQLQIDMQRIKTEEDLSKVYLKYFGKK